MMIIDSNLSHESFEGLRHLYSGPGMGGLKAAGDGWFGIVDGSPAPAGAIVAPEAEISWGPNVARRYGGFPGTQDRALTVGGAALRTIKVRLRALSGAHTLGVWSMTMYVALCRSYAPPDQGYLAFQKVTIDSLTDASFEIFLSAPEGLTGGMAPWRSRANPQRGAVITQTPEFWVWIGAKSTHADDAWIASSIFESYTGSAGVGFGILR